MGFVTARLQRRWGPVLASLAVAPMFGFIYLPLLLAPGFVTNGRPQGLQLLIVIVFLLFINSAPVRIMVTWVYNSTGGSLPIVALMQASFDTKGMSALLTILCPGIDSGWLYIGVALAVRAKGC